MFASTFVADIRGARWRNACDSWSRGALHQGAVVVLASETSTVIPLQHDHRKSTNRVLLDTCGHQVHIHSYQIPGLCRQQGGETDFEALNLGDSTFRVGHKARVIGKQSRSSQRRLDFKKLVTIDANRHCGACTCTASKLQDRVDPFVPAPVSQRSCKGIGRG